MSTTAEYCSERPTGRGRHAPTLGRVLALLIAMWFAVDASDGLAVELGLYERTGGFVLELDTPPRQVRGTCATLGISNFAALPDARVRLVARSGNLPLAGAKHDYKALKIVAVPKSRAGETLVCFDQISGLVRIRSDGTPISVEVAVYRVSDQDLVPDRSGPIDDSTRLSDWLPIPDGLWRGKQRLADRSSRHPRQGVSGE